MTKTTKPKFNFKTQWVSSDGWRGYNEPIYAVCGANDTGSWEDSPCRTEVCKRELEDAVKALGDIPSRMKSCESSNVFCRHVYVVVPPEYIEEARKRFAEYFETVRYDTDLLYAVTGK